MKEILIAILVVLALLLVVIVGGLLWIRAKIKGFFNNLSESLGGLLSVLATGTPDFRIRVRPVEEIEWWHGEQINTWAEELVRKGFVDLGGFRVNDGDTMRLRGLVHEQSRVTAVLYDMEQASRIDLALDYVDGRELVYTTMDDTGLAKPPYATVVRKPDHAPATLYDIMMAERPSGDITRVDPACFTQHLEEAYAREMNWRVEKGGYSDDEVRAMVAASQKAMAEAAAREGRDSEAAAEKANKPVTETTVRQTKMMLQGALSAEASQFIIKANRGDFDPKLVSDETPEHQFFVVQNMSDQDDLTGALPDIDLDDEAMEDRDDRAKKLIREHGPQVAFEMLLAENPRGSEVRKLKSVTEPITAVVYLLPMEVEEAYEGEED